MILSVWKYTILVLFGLKYHHKRDGVWYGILVLEVRYSTPHSTEIKLLAFNITPILYILPLLTTRVATNRPVSYY